MYQSSICFLPCRDLTQTTSFYTQTVGLEVAEQMPGCVIFDTGRGYWGFCAYGDDRPMATGVVLSLNCADNAAVDAEYRRLMAGNAAIVQNPPAMHAVFSVYSFFITDPNGYLVEFQKIQK